MIGWVDDRLHEWARWAVRMQSNLGYPTRSVEGRLMEEGAAAASKGSGPPPMVECPPHIDNVERAVAGMPEHLRVTVKAKYMELGTDKQKAKALRLTERTYRGRIDQAHHWIAGALDQAA